MLWAGDTAAETLPGDAAPRFLNEDSPDLSEDGYVLPPGVSIDPVDVHTVAAGGQLSVRVRLDDPEYPPQAILEVRLYHNGKLVPPERMHAVPGGGMFEYPVRLLPVGYSRGADFALVGR